MIDFPASPVDGQQFTASNGVAYKWQASPGIWLALAVSEGMVAGGDLTGTYPNPTIKPGVSLTGEPTTTQPPGGDETLRIPTTSWVKGTIDAAIGESPPFISPTGFGVMANHAAGSAPNTATDDTTAVKAWLGAAATTGKPTKWSGGIRLVEQDDPIVIPSTTPSFVLEGVTPRQSYFMLDGAFDDYFMRIVDRSGNWHVSSAIYNDDGTFINPPGTLKSLRLEHFAVHGRVTNLDGSGVGQKGIAFVARNDSVEINDVLMTGINGTAMNMGLGDDDVIAGAAMFREASITGLKLVRCGRAANPLAVPPVLAEAAWILSAEGENGLVAPNEIHFVDCASDLAASTAFHMLAKGAGFSASLKFTRLKLHGTSNALSDININAVTVGATTLFNTVSPHNLVQGQLVYFDSFNEGTLATFLNGTSHTVDLVGLTSSREFRIAAITTGMDYTGGGVVYNGITGITPGNPTIITAINHRLKASEKVRIGATTGTISGSLNGLDHVATRINANSFSVPVNSTGMTWLGSGWAIRYTRPQPFTGTGLRLTGGTQRIEFTGLLVLNCACNPGEYAVMLERDPDTQECPSEISIKGSIGGTFSNGIKIDGGHDVYIELEQLRGVNVGTELFVGPYVTGPITVISPKLTKLDINNRAMRWMRGLQTFAYKEASDALGLVQNIALMEMVNGERLHVHATMIGRQTAGTMVGGVQGFMSKTVEGTFKCEADVVSVIDPVTTLHVGQSDPAWTAVMNTITNNVRWRVTIPATTTVKWELTDLQVREVS